MKTFPAKISSWGIVAAIIAGAAITGITMYIILVVKPPIDASFFTKIFSNQTSTENTAPPVDTRPLEVEVVKPQRTVSNRTTDVTVITNKQVTFAEADDVTDGYLGEQDGQHYYLLQVSNIRQAGKKVKVKMTDAVGNEFAETLDIKLKAIALPAGLNYIGGWEGSEYVLDGDKFDVKVNKRSRLREDYAPTNLVDLNKEFGMYTLNNAKLRADVARALDNMLRALKSETGVTDITIVSGYRSYEDQVATYAYWVRTLGQKRADEISARPGHSEHQLGTTFDISTVSLGYELSEKIAETNVGKWLAQHALSYGFKQFNDPDYANEPWHFRYTGQENANQ